MRRFLLLGCISLLTAGQLAAGEFPAAPAAEQQPSDWKAAPPAIEPIAWRQNTFSIPFRVNRPAEAEDAPLEVRLFVSTDRGQNWQFIQSAQPAAGRFVFRAPQDGEFWFSLRTVDRQGRVLPEKPHQPELGVVIDTMPPRLDLISRRGEAGQVEVEWKAVDPHLDPESLKIEYRFSPDEAWQPLALTPAAPGSKSTRSGKASWWPEIRHGELTIRGEIGDEAGNRTVSQSLLALHAPQGANTAAGIAAAPPHAQGPLASTAQRPIPFSQQIIPSQLSDDGTGHLWPADRLAARPLGSSISTAAPFAQRASQSPNNTTPQANLAAQAPSAQAHAPTQQNPAGLQPLAPRDSGNVESGRYADAPPPGPYRAVSQSRFTPTGAPSGNTEVRMVNARTFELQYDIESIGPAGIARVELWSTRDQGQTWTLHTTDADNRSPAHVEVDGEGLYGFCIVVHASNGLGSRVPQSGDAPEVSIGVDLTPPQVQLISALPGTGNQADHLIIKWDASDAQLDPRPISLFYAPQPGQPWQTIAAGLENTGTYAWRLTPDVPDELHLRIEARDAAGNLSEQVSFQPVKIHRPRPQGRIRNVRPVEPSPQAPPAQY